MKHLKNFETEAEYVSYKNGSDFVLPNISYVEESKGVAFNPYVEPTSPNLVCVYDIVDTSRETQIMSSYGSYAYTSMIVDGVEMDFDCYYQFNTEGLHTVEFVFDEEYKTELPSQGFDYVTQLVSITIPDSITSISLDSIAFSNLKEFKGKYASKDGKCLIIDNKLHMVIKKDLTSFIIPDSVTEIGWGAFSNCSNLTSITIPASVTTIGGSAFSSCSSLESVTIPDSVTAIEDSAFSHCRSLTSVNIPDSVTKIGSHAFYDCDRLTNVTIGDSVTIIGDYAFNGCDSLESVTIGDSVTTIGTQAFNNCTGELIINSKIIETDYEFENYPSKYGWLSGAKFTKLTIGDGIERIGDYAFYNCNSLTSVTIGDSVTAIGKNAFDECSSLTSVTIPDSVTIIGDYAFEDCSLLPVIDSIRYADTYLIEVVDKSLTSYSIKEGTRFIGDGAFYNCNSLTSVTIPDSVTAIGTQAFEYCRSLTSVYCKATTPPAATSYNSYWTTFDDNASGRKIYVPMESVEAYKSASGWSSYADDIVGYNF